MNNALRSGIVLCLSLSLTWLSSCSDDDEASDTTAPTVTFSNLTDDEAVWNTLSTTVDVGDADIEKLEVYIDGTLLTTITEAPYEIEWDSNTVPDGQHVVKVVVTDKSGNSTSKEVTITVKNILLSFDVADDQLITGEGEQTGEVGLVILSDEDGDVIASTEYKNGDHIELRSSSFNGETFTVTESIIGSMSYYPVAFWTYPQVERGKWSVYHELKELEEEEYPDPASLEFSNAAADEYYLIATNGNSFTMSGNIEGSIPAELIKSPSKLYVATQNSETNTYRLFPSVASGATVTVDLSQVDQQVSKTTVDKPQGAEYVEVYLEGYAVAGSYDYTERYRIGWYYNEQSSSVTVEYPGTAFPSYYSETYYSTDNYYFTSGRTNAFYNIAPVEYNVTFDLSDGKLKCTSSGSYDFVTASFWSDHDGIETKWGFILPKGSNQSVAIPLLEETVEALLEDYYPDFDLSPYLPDLSSQAPEYSVYEYEAIEGYQGVKDLIREATLGIGDLMDRPHNFTQLDNKDNSGGRISSRSKTENRRERRTW